MFDGGGKFRAFRNFPPPSNILLPLMFAPGRNLRAAALLSNFSETFDQRNNPWR